MGNNTVTGVAGSIRSGLNADRVVEIIERCRSFEDLFNLIYKEGGDRRISNSEALLVSGLFGATEAGAQVSYLKLKDHLRSNKQENFADHNAIENTSAGYIVSSPVYFGDRSSLIEDWIEIMKQRNGGRLPLNGKSVGAISVGAKRNGGQETTNIFFLADVLEMGACVVGNGPPTSQYGGTGWAGHIGAIIDDNFGLMTSRGTGQRVSVLSKFLSSPHTSSKVRILFLVMSKDKRENFISEIKNLPFSSDVELRVLDVSKLTINKCIACPVCPNGDLEGDYKCIIARHEKECDTDDMRMIQKEMMAADAIVCARYSGIDSSKDNYQHFIERTRCIRRDNYVLSDRLFSSYNWTNSINDISHIRIMSSFLRHNMFILGPFYRRMITDSAAPISESLSTADFVGRLENYTRRITAARRKGLNEFDYVYTPIGYPKLGKG